MEYRFKFETYEMVMSQKTHQLARNIRHFEYFDYLTDVINYLVHGKYERCGFSWRIIDRQDDEEIANGDFTEAGSPTIIYWY